MSAISTHVVDLTAGLPGSDIMVRLEHKSHNHGWQVIGDGVTDSDGRVNDLLAPQTPIEPGHYRLIFETGPYYLQNGTEGFFPQVVVSFVVKDPSQDYHIPLLISRYGYTTYRGS